MRHIGFPLSTQTQTQTHIEGAQKMFTRSREKERGRERKRERHTRLLRVLKPKWGLPKPKLYVGGTKPKEALPESQTEHGPHDLIIKVNL